MPKFRIKKVKRKKAFLVCWYEKQNGKLKEKSKAFEDRKLAQDFIDERTIQTKEYGQRALSVDFGEYEKFLEFKKLIGHSDLKEVAHFWNKYSNKTETPQKLKDAIDSFIESKTEITRVCLNHYKVRLNRMASYFGNNTELWTIKTEALEDWLKSLNQSFQKTTIHHHRTDAKTFFNWCLKAPRRWIKENPVSATEQIKVHIQKVQILTPEETSQLMEANKNNPIIGRLALEVFAGLRASSASRIKKEEINFQDKGIELPASKIKTRKRIYVSGFPETLWKWLEITPKECWKMTEGQIEHEKSKAFSRANLRHPHNCLRHGFCTYHLTAFGDIGKSMTLSCHTSIGTFNEHYRGICTVADAKTFWEIIP